MIYSQTTLHNRSVRVSIKADGDGAVLTFSDSQWSVVPSVPPSSLFSYLSYSPFCPPSEIDTCKSSPLHLLHLYSSKIPNVFFFFTQFIQLWKFNCSADVQDHDSGDGTLLELTSSVLSMRLSAC